MTTIRKIAKNTGVLFAGQIISYVLGFIYVIYIARYLGAEGFGILTLALSFTGISVVLTDLGLNKLIVRDISRDESLIKKYLGNFLSMKIILAFFMLFVTILAINLFNYSNETTIVIYLITISTIFTSFSQLFYSIFQIYQKMEYQAVGIIINSALILGGAFLGKLYGLNVTELAFLYLFATIIVLVYNILACSLKFMIPKINFDFPFWKTAISNSIYFGLADIFIVIYFNIDSVMLSLIVGEAVVGWYNAAYRLIFVLTFIPSVLIIALFPLMSKHFESAKETLKMEYGKSFKYLFAISVILLVYGILFADQIILNIYGNGYLPAISALQVLICVIPIIFITTLFGNLLAAINRQRVVTLIAGANALLNVALNLILIPDYSFIGASVATVLTEGLGFILMYYYISRYFTKISITENILKPILCGVIIAAFIYYLKIEINWLLAGIIGLLSYILLLYIFKIINEDDIVLFRQIFK